jgi:hypothetical protein
VTDLALFIASADVLSEEVWVDGVHNLQRVTYEQRNLR